MINKFQIVGLAAALTVGAIGLSNLSASATGSSINSMNHQRGSGQGQGQGQGQGYQKSLETRAKVFGISTEELKTALETKTMSQIAVEKGLNETEFRAKMTEAAKARWAERGLNEAEIAERIEMQKEHQAENGDCEFGSSQGANQAKHRLNR